MYVDCWVHPPPTPVHCSPSPLPLQTPEHACHSSPSPPPRGLTTTTMTMSKMWFPLPPLTLMSSPCHPFPRVFACVAWWRWQQRNLPSCNCCHCPPVPLSPPHCCLSGLTTYSYFLWWGAREWNLLYLDNCYTYCKESSCPEFWNLRQWYFSM